MSDISGELFKRFTRTCWTWRHHTRMTPIIPFSRLRLACAIGLFCVSQWAQAQAPAPAQNSALPSLGDGDGMSIAEERRLGDSIVRDIYRDPDYLDDPVLADYLDSIWRPLLAAARARGDIAPELSDRLAWELAVSRDKRVNAFALPGGYFGVYLGLVATTESSDELASVLAHELSHVSQRHIARMLSRQNQQAPWIMGAMILGVLAARANTDVANAAIAGSQAVAAQTQLNFSRDMEREADRIGFGVMTQAGFEGMGFVSMFDRLYQASRLNDDGSFPYLRSHPLTTERMADIRSRLPLVTPAPQGPRVGAVIDTTPSAALHPLMAARARVISEPSTERQRAWVDQGSSPKAKPADLYLAALSALRLGQLPQALRLARQGADHAPEATRQTWALLQLEILSAPGGVGLDGTSLASLRTQALAAQGRASMLLGAQATVLAGGQGEASLAAARLSQWLAEHRKDAQAWLTLSRVQATQGQRLRSIRSEAESRAALQDYAGAIDRLRAAQALPAAERAADRIETAIVDARLREIEAQQKEADSARQQ